MSLRRISRRQWRVWAVRCALACTLGVAAFSAPPAGAQALTAAEIGQFAGPDRMERLIAGAREEGSLTLYTAATLESMNAITDEFERRYGVSVRIWRGGAIDVLQRTLTEARAGHHAVDVLETPGSEIEALARENLLQEIFLPVFADLMPQAVAPGRPWVATRMIVFTAAYNTDIISADELPTSYEDLLDPKWRGKLGIETTDVNWFQTLVMTMGEEEGLQLFRDIISINGISGRKGHTLLTTMVASGEVPLALNVYTHRVDPLRRAGAPIAPLFLKPNLAVPSGIAVMKNAPHPHAAVLFVDFILSEDGQRILASFDSVPAHLSVQTLPEGLNLTILDIPGYVDEIEKWRAIFHEYFIGQTH